MAGITLDTFEEHGFAVRGFNKHGRVVPLTDAAVSVADTNVATATVHTDGTNGVLTGQNDGTTVMTATAAGLSATLDVTVAADNVVASLTIDVSQP